MDKEEKLWAYKMSLFSGLTSGLVVTLISKILIETENATNPVAYVIILFIGGVITLLFLLFFLWLGDKLFIK